MENTLYNIQPFYHSISSSYTTFYQQDTLTNLQTKDTTKKVPEGINPLFLQAEKRAKEIEAYKTQLANPKPKISKPKPNLADTTCYFCPTGELAPLHKTITQSENQLQPFVKDLLFDKELFKQLYAPSGPVFIEKTIPESNTIISTIDIKPIEKDLYNTEWLFFPMIGLLILLGFLKLFFLKETLELFRGSIFFRIANKILRDTSAIWTRFFLLLDFVPFIAIPISATLALNHFILLQGITQNSYLFALYVFLALLAFRVFRYITIKLIGLIANQNVEARILLSNQLIYTRIFALFLIPVNLILAYSSGSFQIGLFYAMGVFFGIILLLRIVRTLQVFLYNGYSLFYFILYLCALEIIPILLVYKALL